MGFRVVYIRKFSKSKRRVSQNKRILTPIPCRKGVEREKKGEKVASMITNNEPRVCDRKSTYPRVLTED